MCNESGKACSDTTAAPIVRRACRRGGTVDAWDLKSLGEQSPCRFDSCRRHQDCFHDRSVPEAIIDPGAHDIGGQSRDDMHVRLARAVHTDDAFATKLHVEI